MCEGVKYIVPEIYMGGLPILHGITKSCCALQERRRKRWVRDGLQLDSPDFGCTECGSHYRWEEGYGWRKVDPLEALIEMVLTDSRGHLS